MKELLPFDPEVRVNQITWQIEYIKMMLVSAEERRNPNISIYACFETRNLLEKIEFDIVMAAMSAEERELHFDNMQKINGSKNTFSNLSDASFSKYFSYLKALCNVHKVPPPSDFDIKIANKFKVELNSYCHLYSCDQEDFEYGSPFNATGESICKQVLAYLKDCGFIKEDGSVTIIGTTVSELDEKSEGLFTKWKKNEIKTEADLFELLQAQYEKRISKK